jgi:hypothetical protein
MASSPAAPSTPLADTPRRLALNRSFTVPAKLATPPKATNNPEIGAAKDVETLYVHPNASVVKFTTSSRPSSSGSNPSPGKTQPTLSWTSPTERTMAVGPLEIYRVPGSVSFLRSGSLLQALMPKHNCWCVDGVSKFALRIFPDTYYRIELPGETEEDLEAVEEFKVVLKKVLYFERTPSPFAPGYTAEDVEEEDSKRRKGRRRNDGPAKKWRLSGRIGWRPEGWVPPEEGGEEGTSGSEGVDPEEEESESDAKSGAEEVADEVADLKTSSPVRPRIRTGFRSVTAPSPVTTEPPSGSNLRTRVDIDGTVEACEHVETSSARPSTPSSRTLQAIPTSMPPSPPDSSAGLGHAEDHEDVPDGIVDEPSLGDDASITEPLKDKDQQSKLDPKAANSRTQKPLITEDENDEDEKAADERSEDASPIPTRLAVPEPSVEAEDRQPTCIETESLDDQVEQAEIVHTDNVNESATQVEPDRNLPPEEQLVASQESKAEQPLDDGELIESAPALPLPVTQDDAAAEASEERIDDRPVTPVAQTNPEDPYAAIQARILARRSIGGTTNFQPVPRTSTSSTSSTSTTLSRRSQPVQNQQAFASAMVRKACAAFLGPPARLVAIMLKIAARYADAAFGVNSVFYVESDGVRNIPGSFWLQEEDVLDDEDDEGEDDFGVPLRSPVRLASFGDRGLRERRAWDVD